MPIPTALFGVAALLLARGLALALPSTLVQPAQGEALIDDGAAEKQLVVACNGFASDNPAIVGVRPLGPLHLHHKKRNLKHRRGHPGAAKGGFMQTTVGLHPSLARKGGPSPAEAGTKHESAKGGASEVQSAIWTRSLAYGACEEYHVDLSRRQLFFAGPDGGSCELAPPAPESDHDEGAGGIARHLVAAVGQLDADSPQRCAVHAVALGSRFLQSGAAAAELAILDVFVQGGVEADEAVEELKSLTEAEQRRGLRSLPPLDSGAVVRLEDEVETQTIASEVVASRTLGFGRTYAVEPKNFHVLLEDFRGTTMLGRTDVGFESGRTYIALRAGLGGNTTKFPQHLFFHKCEQEMGPEDPQGMWE